MAAAIPSDQRRVMLFFSDSEILDDAVNEIGRARFRE